MTLFRLAINISRHAPDPARTATPATVIHAFGKFVVGGNFVVGIVIFLILVIIQFVVITNGAGRVAEVARALHPGRDARQADGDRRRPERRPHHRGRGARAAAERSSRGRLLRRDGRRLEVRARRRRRRPDHRGRQHLRAASSIGMLQQGLAAREALQHLHAADGRRRHRGADPGAADLDRDRHHRHPLGRQRVARLLARGTALRAAARRSSSPAP